MKKINLNFAPNETFKGALETLTLLTLEPKKNSIPILNDKLSTAFKTESSKVFTFLSARSALKVLFESLNFSKGSEVLVLGFTCEAVVLPIIENNLVPIYVDIENESLSFDYDDLVKKYSPNTRAVILQHSFGMTPKYRERILQFANKKNLLVIEDLAHGFHIEAFHVKDQTLKLLSFGRSKLLSAVHGGALIFPTSFDTSNFNTIYENIDLPSNTFVYRALTYKLFTPILKVLSGTVFAKILHFLFNKLGLFTKEISLKEKSAQYDSWLEYRLPKSFANLLVTQFDNYKDNVQAKTSISKLYMNYFEHSFSSVPILRYPLLVDNIIDISKYFEKNGVFVGNWYQQPVAPKGLKLDAVFYRKGSCPKAEELCEHIINLPTNISKDQAEWITKLYAKY